jgi:hypothetical protein
MGKAILVASLGALCSCGASSGQLPDPDFAGTWNGSAVFYIYSQQAAPPAQVQIVVTLNANTVAFGLCPGLQVPADGAGDSASWFMLTGNISCAPMSVDVGPNDFTSGWTCPSVVFRTPSGNAMLSNNTLTINAGGDYAGCGTTVGQGTGMEFSGIK